MILVEQPRLRLHSAAPTPPAATAPGTTDDADYDEDDRRVDLPTNAPGASRSKYDVTWLDVTHDAVPDDAVERAADAMWTALNAKLTPHAPELQVWFKEEAPIVAVCARDIDAAQVPPSVLCVAPLSRSFD